MRKLDMAEHMASELDQTRASTLRAIAELRAAIERTLGFWRDQTANWDAVAVQSLLGARDVGERINRNFEDNVRAIFDAAEEQVRARSVSEFFQIYQRFLTDMAERSLDQAEDMEGILRGQSQTFAGDSGRTPGG